MSRFKPVVVKGKPLDQALQAFADALNATHQCIHQGHEAQAERDAAADAKREALSEKVGDLATEVGSVKTLQEVDSGRITTLAKMLGAEKVEPGEKRPKPHSVMGVKDLAKIAAAVGGAAGGVVFLYKLIAALAPGFHQFMLTVAT